MAGQINFSLSKVESIEGGYTMPDIVEVRTWCHAVGMSLTKFAIELDAALVAEEAEQEQNRKRAMETDLDVPKLSNPEPGNLEPGKSESSATNICVLRFATGALPELLSVENTPRALTSLLETNKVRVFATGNPATLGLSAAQSTDENSARGADAQGDCTLLHPTAAFLVVAGAFGGAQVSPSAPRNQGLEWAPLAAWVPLYPHALDLADTKDWERLRLGSLSPLQLEFALDRFAPRLSHGAVEDIMSEHPDGVEWMAAWND